MRKHLQHLPRSKHRDDIVVANIEVDKVDMVADMEVDIEIDMEIQFGERVGWWIGPKLVQPKAYLACASSIIYIYICDSPQRVAIPTYHDAAGAPAKIPIA